MPKDEKLKRSETVVRVLVRLPAELKGRPTQDTEDFLRKKDYNNTGLPENGLSFLRKSILQTPDELYAYLRSKKPMGYSECTLGELADKHLKYKVTGAKNEHLSVRCADCNMIENKDKGIVCMPEKSKGFENCPFFGVDPYDLNLLLNVVEKPAARKLSPPAK
ncbi:MAG: hypothetical protein QG625_3509 [Cyanobacteriota bacterium erpe_2018_sw_39hr_WHONDRS-SW48-000098_B_bin.30]|jgi:hypothetical protein|nr:hypothetical protein [Candidatus Obscuribacter sp.]MBK9619669.1 hypothetical protein [Candidatus Obscuribacter sp.]MDQ5967353.1 hypothetical protein [Cyanobacteriota bacterium erpe_2018_sw_39hr_WHONDRS-SW48-000098_B_bin.30]